MGLCKLTKTFENFIQKFYPSSRCNLVDLSERVDSARARGSVNGTFFEADHEVKSAFAEMNQK